MKNSIEIQLPEGMTTKGNPVFIKSANLIIIKLQKNENPDQDQRKEIQPEAN